MYIMEEIETLSETIKESKLPSKLGQKSFDSSLVDKDKLESFLTEYQSLLATNRKTNKKKVSIVKYNKSDSSLHLKTMKGNYWNYYGFKEKRVEVTTPQTILHPFEVIYLQECGVLQIICTEGGPWSIQKTYHTLLEGTNQVQLHHYQVYAHLKRGGYIVQIKQDILQNNAPLLIVYKPQKSFKKSSPGQPDSVVILTSLSCSFPLLKDINFINIKYPNTELRYAVVNGNDINYYSLYKMDSLPLPV